MVGFVITLDYTAAAGDVISVYATATDAFRITIERADGEPVLGLSVLQQVTVEDSAVATGSTIMPFDDTIPQIGEGTVRKGVLTYAGDYPRR